MPIPPFLDLASCAMRACESVQLATRPQETRKHMLILRSCPCVIVCMRLRLPAIVHNFLIGMRVHSTLDLYLVLVYVHLNHDNDSSDSGTETSLHQRRRGCRECMSLCCCFVWECVWSSLRLDVCCDVWSCSDTVSECLQHRIV